jgi:ABC-type enterochelin transport system permease subunit
MIKQDYIYIAKNICEAVFILLFVMYPFVYAGLIFLLLRSQNIIFPTIFSLTLNVTSIVAFVGGILFLRKLYKKIGVKK